MNNRVLYLSGAMSARDTTQLRLFSKGAKKQSRAALTRARLE